MKIIGIDPGTLHTGYGIINYEQNEVSLIYAGVINTSPKKDLSERLKVIYDEVNQLIKIYQPDEFSIETAFFGKNIQSALKLGHARGVAFLAAAHNGLVVNEYSPREIKRAVVGNGAATKEQVQYMIQNILKTKKELKFDISDALAIAVCHAFRLKTFSKGKTSWSAFIKANPDRIKE
ncbi:MAG: crossover junction endodeoxyribonuclease RuvC [Melioribacteraceae bacterium]|nr:crossover junction endodeoxyribonuclease RuvC [Melioribacteraceae bacterium]